MCCGSLLLQSTVSEIYSQFSQISISGSKCCVYLSVLCHALWFIREQMMRVIFRRMDDEPRTGQGKTHNQQVPTMVMHPNNNKSKSSLTKTTDDEVAGWWLATPNSKIGNISWWLDEWKPRKAAGVRLFEQLSLSITQIAKVLEVSFKFR